MDNLAPTAANQHPNDSYQYDQHASPLQYPLPQRQQFRYHQQQHEYINQDPSSSTLFMQAWLSPDYDARQEPAFHDHDPNMHTSSLLTNNAGQVALSTNDHHQHLGNNNLALGSPSSISTSLSELSSTAAFYGSHNSSPATTTSIGNTTEEPATSQTTSRHASTTSAIETSSAPVEDWKQRAHEAIWAINTYQRKRRRCRSSSSSKQDADDNETTSNHHDDDNYDEESSLQSSSSQPASSKRRRTTAGFTCKQCNIHFTRDRDLKRHNLSKHVRQRYVCGHCSNSFTRNDSKVRHERKCTAKRKKDQRDDGM